MDLVLWHIQSSYINSINFFTNRLSSSIFGVRSLSTNILKKLVRNIILCIFYKQEILNISRTRVTT